MHMADALVSPAVGGSLWVAAGGLIAYCARQVKRSPRDDLVPLMGVLGAFVFAAQMINFSIPGTGSSGHLGGGLLLAILLGPHAAFLVIASVLTVQALCFADGGLLALGANVLNMGLFPAFVAYPLLYRPLAGARRRGARAWLAAGVAAVAGVHLGAWGVVLETMASGISALPFGAFVLAMIPIHLAIGVVEGLATAAVVAFVAQARPEALPVVGKRPVWVALAVGAALLGGIVSWFASSHPDGLEWSIARVVGSGEMTASEAGVHKQLGAWQEKTAFLPDYGFKADAAEEASAERAVSEPEAWPAVRVGTSTAGIVGGALTLALALLIGVAVKWRPSPAAAGNG